MSSLINLNDDNTNKRKKEWEDNDSTNEDTKVLITIYTDILVTMVKVLGNMKMRYYLKHIILKEKTNKVQ